MSKNKPPYDDDQLFEMAKALVEERSKQKQDTDDSGVPKNTKMHKIKNFSTNTSGKAISYESEATVTGAVSHFSRDDSTNSWTCDKLVFKNNKEYKFTGEDNEWFI